MRLSKPFLLLQLRPEDVTSDSEYEAILEHSGLRPDDVRRIRIEQSGFPEIDLNDFKTASEKKIKLNNYLQLAIQIKSTKLKL